MSIGSIVIWIVAGAIAGVLAKLIMPGDDPGGITVTSLIGIAGALAGGFLTSLIGLGQDGLIWTIIVATISAIILLVIYRLLVGSVVGRVAVKDQLLDALEIVVEIVEDLPEALIYGRARELQQAFYERQEDLYERRQEDLYERRQEAPENRDTATSFLDIGQILATYIGIPAVLLYPVGFLVFVLQIDRFYPFDFSTAWYAASLIPATVVTGQGVKYLLLPLLISVLISSLGARALIVRYELPSALWLGILLSVLVLLPLGIVVFALVAGREGLLYWAFFIPLGALSGLTGARYILNSYYKHLYSADDRQREGATGFVDWFSRGVRERWIFKGLLTAYAGSVISAFLIVFPLDWLDQDPDLPHVKMKTPSRVIEDGVLLSHSDGYWHVIDTSRVDTDPSIERQSFTISPGKDVSYVRVYESPLQKADIDLALVPPDSPWVITYLTYTVKVINNGPDTASGIELTNDLPDNEVEFVSASRGQEGINCSPEENAGPEKKVITCTVGKLDRDDSAEIHIKVRPEADATAQDPFTFKVDVNGAQRDPDPIDEKAKSVEVKIDREQPETENLSTEANANRWYKENVTIKLDAEDNKSGVKEITYSTTGEQPISKTTYDPERPPVITKQGVTEVHYYAEDIAGNIEPAESFTVRLDKISPSVTIDSGPEGPTKDSTTSFGFSSDESGSTFECRRDDATFGACDPPQTYDNLADGEHTFQVRAKDRAGNVGNTIERNFMVDTVKPTIECGTADDSWHEKDVSIECTASDDGPGLSDDSVSLSTSVPDGSETDDAATNSREICDAAGNCATAGPIRRIKIDKKAPDIVITAPADGAEYELEETVTAKYACSDGGSGVESCKGPVARGSETNTDLGGSQSFKVEATDAAGNAAIKSHTYAVAYKFGHFLSPLKAPPALNVTRAGDPVLVRFGLEGGQGKDIYAEGYPHSVEIECDPQDPINPLRKSNPQDTVDRHDYVWDTDETWSGTCRQLILKLNDGSTHSLRVKFVE